MRAVLGNLCSLVLTKEPVRLVQQRPLGAQISLWRSEYHILTFIINNLLSWPELEVSWARGYGNARYTILAPTNAVRACHCLAIISLLCICIHEHLPAGLVYCDVGTLAPRQSSPLIFIVA